MGTQSFYWFCREAAQITQESAKEYNLHARGLFAILNCDRIVLLCLADNREL